MAARWMIDSTIGRIVDFHFMNRQKLNSVGVAVDISLRKFDLLTWVVVCCVGSAVVVFQTDKSHRRLLGFVL
jgi:hypothetical protein